MKLRPSTWMLHGELGRGGAERWLLDTADVLSDANDVIIFSYCEVPGPNYSFNDLHIKDKTFRCQYIKTYVPRALYGKCIHFMAVINMVVMALMLWFMIVLDIETSPEVIISDHVAIINPILRLLFPSSKVYFYCHFPESCLQYDIDEILHEIGEKYSSNKILKSKNPFNILNNYPLYNVYRNIMATMESYGLRYKRIGYVTNSYFSRSILAAFSGCSKESIKVLYPCFKPRHYTSEYRLQSKITDENNEILILSLNRLHRSKRHEMAIWAVQRLMKNNHLDIQKNIKLIIAGNSQDDVYIDYLQNEIDVKLPGKGVLYTDVTDSFKDLLLSKCSVVIYTPEYEHFGIGVIEAMNYKKPVIVSAVGGPSEILLNENMNELEEEDLLSRLLVRDTDNVEEYARALKIGIGLAGRKDFNKQVMQRLQYFDWDQFYNKTKNTFSL